MAAIQHYDQGDVWTPQATFTVNGAATDPSNITVRIKNPDETVTVLGPFAGATGGTGIVRVSAGVFKTDIALADAGPWYVRFEGTGTAAGTEEHQAIVDPSVFFEAAQLGTRSLVSLAEAKDWLNQQNIDTSSDLELARVIVDVSDRFHREARREFKVSGTNPQTRLFDIETLGRSRPWYIDGEYQGDISGNSRELKIGDATTITAVSILSWDWTTVLEAVTPLSKILQLPATREPWEPIRTIVFAQDVTPLAVGYRVSVTGTWGFPAVPGNVRQAVLDAVASIMDRDVEHYRQDLAVQPPGEGNVIMVGGGGGQRLLSMPPSSLAVAWDYRDASLG